jgi:MarR family 2-MHQ and catechol resistance regulon transcriptional repressor
MATRRPAAVSNDKLPVRERPQIRALRLLLRAHARVLDDHRRHIEAAHGLLMTEFDMIAALGNTEGLRMGELANAMITTPGNVTRVAQALEKRGLVERGRAPHSDREVLAHLTPAGEEFFRKHFQGVVAFTTSYMDAALSTAEQQQLAVILKKLIEASLIRNAR